MSPEEVRIVEFPRGAHLCNLLCASEKYLLSWGGLMSSEPMTAIKEDQILKVVLVVGVLASVLFKELIDGDFALPRRLV